MKINNKKSYKVFCLFAITIMFLFQNYVQASTIETPVQNKTVTSAPNEIKVSPVDVVNNPAKYLNKNITFEANFVAYSALGLDYKPAFRDSSKYIGILVQRDDVKGHVIPLSEMKLFLDRETAEKNVDLESGDKIKITGNVFSCALGDPWVDIKSFTVLTTKKKDTTKK